MSVITLKIKFLFEKFYGIKLNMKYLKFLIEIIEDYFRGAFTSITDSFLEI